MDCQHCTDCRFENGQCHCGCTEQTKLLSANSLYTKKFPEGSRAKFISGHQNKSKSRVPHNRMLAIKERARAYIEDGTCGWCEDECDVGPGLCHCGCGKRAKVSSMNRWADGMAQGMPYRTLRGHHARQLSDEQVQEIRHLYATTEITQDELAERFGVTQVTICRVMLYDSHKNAGIKRP